MSKYRIRAGGGLLVGIEYPELDVFGNPITFWGPGTVGEDYGLSISAPHVRWLKVTDINGDHLVAVRDEDLEPVVEVK